MEIDRRQKFKLNQTFFIFLDYMGKTMKLVKLIKEKGLRFSSKPLNSLVGHKGLEPLTNGLRVRCSTN